VEVDPTALPGEVVDVTEREPFLVHGRVILFPGRKIAGGVEGEGFAVL
jgi:hypothetical protein